MIQPTLIKSVSYTQGDYTVTFEKGQNYDTIEVENKEKESLRFNTDDFSLEAVIEALQTIKSLRDQK
jgi:hypothetical protein